MFARNVLARWSASSCSAATSDGRREEGVLGSCAGVANLMLLGLEAIVVEDRGVKIGLGPGASAVGVDGDERATNSFSAAMRARFSARCCRRWMVLRYVQSYSNAPEHIE